MAAIIFISTSLQQVWSGHWLHVFAWIEQQQKSLQRSLRTQAKQSEANSTAHLSGCSQCLFIFLVQQPRCCQGTSSQFARILPDKIAAVACKAMSLLLQELARLWISCYKYKFKKGIHLEITFRRVARNAM